MATSKRLYRDASELGLKPGQWPEKIEIDGKRYYRDRPQMRDGEVEYVQYSDVNNYQYVRVMND